MALLCFPSHATFPPPSPGPVAVLRAAGRRGCLWASQGSVCPSLNCRFCASASQRSQRPPPLMTASLQDREHRLAELCHWDVNNPVRNLSVFPPVWLGTPPVGPSKASETSGPPLSLTLTSKYFPNVVVCNPQSSLLSVPSLWYHFGTWPWRLGAGLFQELLNCSLTLAFASIHPWHQSNRSGLCSDPLRALGGSEWGMVVLFPTPDAQTTPGHVPFFLSLHKPGCLSSLSVLPRPSPLCLLRLLSLYCTTAKGDFTPSQVIWLYPRKPPLPHLTGFLTAWLVSPVSPQVACAVLEGKSLSLWSVHPQREDRAWHPLDDTDLC